MISEDDLDLASSFVLDMLSEADTRAFAARLQSNPQLAELVASLNDATLALAASCPARPLPRELKERLLASIAKQSHSGDHPTSTTMIRPNFRFLPWAAAAGVAALFAWQSTLWQSERKALAEVNRQATASVERFRDQMAVKERDYQEKLVQEADLRTSVEQDRQRLLAEVDQLQKKDHLAQAKIAVLGSILKDRPKAVGVSLWSQEQQNGLLVVENLPALAKGRDYQLWVIDPTIAAPVSAGVFKVDSAGRVRISFKPNRAIDTAGKFAITEEQEGGVAAPTMNKMVVIGGF